MGFYRPAMDTAMPARRRARSHPRMPGLPLRVGTRDSPLALTQTRMFLDALMRVCPVLRDMNAFEEHAITTTGDTVQDRALAEIGGKGLFAKEIHEALLDGRIDFAVHSLKDLETELPAGIVLACSMRREDARDALILPEGAADPADPFRAIPRRATVGSASLRRQAQILAARPDLKVVNFRGNVGGRIAKVRAGEVGASFLALAGLRRLGLAGDAAAIIEPHIMLPAAGQGIVGVTMRAENIELAEMLSAIEDPEAAAVSRAERALLAALDGNCRTPIGGHATMTGDELRLEGLTARADGSFLLRRSIAGPAKDAISLGLALGAELRRDSPADIFG